ncbi:MAG TPA: hypothetical protein VLK25_10335 [Allosphingosinicella sp.]|nr:hypothetical protein [Allosphingosinicella sp.]
MTMLSAILAAALAQASPAAAPAEPAPVPPAPLPASDAVALFVRMCVSTLPDPAAFARSLSNSGIAWTAYEQPHREPGVGGNYWRAAQGELAYLYRRNADGSGPNPACELSFRTVADADQASTTATVAAALGLGAGQRDGAATRWETRLANNTEVRVTLAPADGLGGPALRLAMFAWRLPPSFE